MFNWFPHISRLHSVNLNASTFTHSSGVNKDDVTWYGDRQLMMTMWHDTETDGWWWYGDSSDDDVTWYGNRQLMERMKHHCSRGLLRFHCLTTPHDQHSLHTRTSKVALTTAIHCCHQYIQHTISRLIDNLLWQSFWTLMTTGAETQHHQLNTGQLLFRHITFPVARPLTIFLCI